MTSNESQEKTTSYRMNPEKIVLTTEERISELEIELKHCTKCVSKNQECG